MGRSRSEIASGAAGFRTIWLMAETSPPPHASEPIVGGSFRVMHAQWSGSSWLARCLIASAFAILIVLAVLLLVPTVIIGGAVLAVGLARSGFQRMVQRAQQPNGALDGRRNVRVRLPDNGR